MSVPVEEFVKHLEDSGVLAGETLKDVLPPKAAPKDADELARELVRQKKLTQFQADILWQGQRKSLVLLRSITTLTSINRKPAAEFWKEIDEQKGKMVSSG